MGSRNGKPQIFLHILSILCDTFLALFRSSVHLWTDLLPRWRSANDTADRSCWCRIFSTLPHTPNTWDIWDWFRRSIRTRAVGWDKFVPTHQRNTLMHTYRKRMTFLHRAIELLSVVRNGTRPIRSMWKRWVVGAVPGCWFFPFRNISSTLQEVNETLVGNFHSTPHIWESCRG